MNEVYGIVSGSHLGDVWLIVSGALRLSQQRGAPVYLSRYAFRSDTFEVCYDEDFSNLIWQCIDALVYSGAEVVVTDLPQNQHHQLDRYFTIPHSAFYCTQPPLPTRCRWTGPPDVPVVSVQMESLRYSDGQYGAELPNWLSAYRNCPTDKLLAIYRCLLCLQSATARMIGKHQGSVANSIRTLSLSTIFIGIDSGMSHIASSVGLPTYIWYWEHAENRDLNVHAWHKNKNIRAFQDVLELEQILEVHGIN